MKIQEIKENILLTWELSIFVIFTLTSYVIEIFKTIAFGKDDK